MTFQVDLTQKKNGTFLANATAVDETQGQEQHLKANPYKDAETFRAALRSARLASAAEATLEQTATEAESRPETQVTCEVTEVEQGQLRKIGLN